LVIAKRQAVMRVNRYYNQLHERQKLAAASALYTPEMESDSCGVGFVASIDGVASNKVSVRLHIR
jgi:hypothetical protein